MPKAKRSTSRKGHRSAPSGGPYSENPLEKGSEYKSMEESYQACIDAALWSFGKLVEFLIIAYGAAALGVVFVYGSSQRGWRSFRNLGSAAILMLVWGAVLSSGAVLVAKVGWTTLLFLAAAAFGLFRYYGTVAGLLVVGVYSLVALCLGGSPWMTTLVTLAGCILFYFRHAALAIFIGLVYTAFSMYKMGGLFALAGTFLVSCLSNDVLQYLAGKLPPEAEAFMPDAMPNSARSSRRSRDWSWKDTTGGSGWGSGSSSKQSSRENFFNSTYGGGRGDSRQGRGRTPHRESGRGESHRDSGRGDGAASSSGSSYSYGGGRGGAESQWSETPPKAKENGAEPSVNGFERGPTGFPRTESFAEDLGAAEAEVSRIVACSTHWAVMGLQRGASIDLAEAKKLYHKKARLVHPDKNGGCANAGEAFKCLQAAYETLIDPTKRKEYEDELMSQDFTERLRKMADDAKAHAKGKNGTSPAGGSSFPGFDPEEFFRESPSKKVHCYNCGESHEWVKVDRQKKSCRWCAECNRYHGAAEGDGWFEQASHAVFFGMFSKDEPLKAFCLEGGQVYECTNWVDCQGMTGRPNTHKPSFEVKSEGRGKGGGGGAGRGGGRGKGRGKEPDLSDCFESEEDFWQFMDDLAHNGGSPGPKGHGSAKGAANGKPKVSKKQRQKAKRNGW